MEGKAYTLKRLPWIDDTVFVAIKEGYMLLQNTQAMVVITRGPVWMFCIRCHQRSWDLCQQNRFPCVKQLIWMNYHDRQEDCASKNGPPFLGAGVKNLMLSSKADAVSVKSINCPTLQTYS